MKYLPPHSRFIFLNPFQVNGSLLSDSLLRTTISIILAGVVALALTVAGIDLLTGTPGELAKPRPILREFAELILIGPLLENGVLFVVGWLLHRMVRHEGLCSLLLAATFAALHGLLDLRWGLIIFPLFWMMSTALHAHRFRWTAFLSIGIIHALNNLFALGLSRWLFI